MELQSPHRMWRWAPFVWLAGIFAVVIAAGAAFRLLSPGEPVTAWWPFYGLWPLFLIFALFWAVRWFFWPWGWGYSRRGYWHGDESYYILRARYARGEITKEQYDQMMWDLGHHP